MATPSPSAAPTEPPKSLADRVLGAIPIVMTVLATLLAGLSSSEMTQAQYHRSLAAQYQSKVGDQWNFFQAKRQRGVLLGSLIDQLQVQRARRIDEDFLACAEELVRDLERVVGRAHALVRALDQAGAAKVGTVWIATMDLAANAESRAGQIAKNLNGFSRSQVTAITRSPLQGREYTNRMRYNLERALLSRSEDLLKAVRAVGFRGSEAEVERLAAGLTPALLHSAIQDAEKWAARYEEEAEPLIQAHKNVARAVDYWTHWLRTLFALSRTLTLAWDDLPEEEVKRLAEVRPALAALLRAVDQVGDRAPALVRESKLAENSYHEQRYDTEAWYNRTIADLYELLVRKSGVTADKHRRRSYLFFYSMLVAQAGVTVATFALAVRQMSALWGLATLAGLAALAAGLYVYWFI